MKYQLKSFYPIYKSGKNISIGIVGTSRYVEEEATSENIELIKTLVSNGFPLSTLSDFAILQTLFEKDMLEEHKDNPLSRSELYFQYLNIPFFSSTIFQSSILIFGAGAAGATLAFLLGQFGFTNIGIVDNDVVELSDVQKTLIYRIEHIGEKKVQALSKILFENYGTNVSLFEQSPELEINLRQIIDAAKPQLVIKACDPNLNFRLLLNKICFEKSIPHFHLSYAFERINLGPFYVPNVTCCDNSLNHYVKNTYGDHNDFSRHEKLFKEYTIHPSISFNINLLANFALKEIIFFFAQRYEYTQTIGQNVFFYPLTMNGSALELQCYSGCEFSQRCQKSMMHKSLNQQKSTEKLS